MNQIDHEPVFVGCVCCDPVLLECLASDLVESRFRLRSKDDITGLSTFVENEEIQVLLMPMEVPKADALAEAIRISRQRGRRPKVAMLGLDPSHRARVSEVGGLYYLEIPFGRTELLDLLEQATRKQKLLVLVDDSDLVHRHTRGVLEKAGYQVRSAMDGLEALRMIRSKRPDLVITDIEMPEMDGYDLCREMKTDPQLGSIPVIICSALGETADLEKGFNVGADDYLVKPAIHEELLSRIRNIFAGIEMSGRERILVVEDSPPVRHLVADALSRQGFEVLTAADGMQGFEAAKEVLPDLLITDYDMPLLTGFELVHALKRNPRTRDIPVMMLTARDTKRDQAQMRAVGLTSYLVKPFSADKCIAVVERLLAERRLVDYKKASQLYLSQGTAQAAEAQAEKGQVGAIRADELVLTVLFTDICGFTHLSQSKSPSEVISLLNGFFDLICPIVLEHGGDIDKFIGDAVMALFMDQEGSSHALRAVQCGLAMQRALASWTGVLHEIITCRIGINTGPVVRGDYGSRHFRRDYSVIGDTVNLAQRFESQAPPGQVLIGSMTYELLKGRVKTRKVEGIQLKGVDHPVTGYLVIDEQNT